MEDDAFFVTTAYWTTNQTQQEYVACTGADPLTESCYVDDENVTHVPPAYTPTQNGVSSGNKNRHTRVHAHTGHTQHTHTHEPMA